MEHKTLNLLIMLPLVTFIGCSSTESARKSPYEADGGAGVSDGGASMRTWPQSGTRYLTAVGLPDIGAVTLPDWVVNPTLDGVLGATGVAGRNSLGTNHQIDEARASARIEIARMLEVRVQDVERRELQQRLSANGSRGVLDEGSSKSMIGVDRNIADSVLSGSRQRALWFDPANGDCYVWIVMDGAVKTKADHYVENGVSVYVANTPITKEFRPEHPKPPEAPKPAMAPAPAPVKGPVEQLESRLKPIEAIPVKGSGGSEQKK